MQPYGRGKMLGSGINPESFKQDFSGFTRAAEIQAQGMANLGANIGGAIEEVGDYFKKQKEDEKKVQKSLSVAKAIGDLIPGLQPTIKGSLAILNDKEIPLSQRTAEADAIENILNLSINEVRNRQDVGFKERELAIRKSEALARNASSKRSANLQLGEIREIINGKPYNVKVTFDPATGETRRLDGSVVSAGFRDSAAIDAGLNTGIPLTASDAERRAIEINNALEIPDSNNAVEANPILLNDFPDGMPIATETPAPVGAPTMTETPAIDALPAQIDALQTSRPSIIPPGATPTESKEVEQARFLTSEEKQKFGLNVNNPFAAKFQGETMISIPEIIKEGQLPSKFRPAIPEEAARYDAVAGQIDESTGRFYPAPKIPGRTTRFNPETNEFEIIEGVDNREALKEQKAQQAKESLVDQNMQDLYFLEDRTRDMAPGVTGAAGRLISEKVFATKQAENKAIIDRISARLTLGTLQSMRENSPTGGALGNVSDKDIEILRNAATSLSNAQSPEEFDRELIRLQNLQYDSIHGSEDLLKKKLKSGEITQDQFDSVQANRPVRLLGDRGQIMSKDTQPSQKPSIGLTPDEMQFLESRPY